MNIIGLKRRGLSRETIHALRAAYRFIFYGEDDSRPGMMDFGGMGGGREYSEEIAKAIDEEVDAAEIPDARRDSSG